MTEGQEVQRGETYDHAEYGQVEVTGIWKGVKRADAAHNTDTDGVIIVRYAPEGDAPRVRELTDTLDEFISVIE